MKKTQEEQCAEKKIGRRDFVKDLVLSGLGAAGAGSLAALFSGCTRTEESAGGKSSGKKRQKKRVDDNIILITVDTLRADHLGCYGHGSIRTPAIDRLGREGVRFRRAFSHSHITLPSHLSILTSLYPKDHQVISNGKQALNPEVVTMAQLLKPHGYHTAAIVSVPLLTGAWISGIERGFDDFVVPSREEYGAEETNKAVCQWLREHYADTFFLWIHYFDPHMPYTPPPPYDTLYYSGDPRQGQSNTMSDVIFPAGFYQEPYRRLIDWLEGVKDIRFPLARYEGEISYVDHQLGKLLDLIETLGLHTRTLISVTADHGESLGEHNIFFAHQGLYDSTVHVPLIFWRPGRLPARVLDGITSSVDILPTLFEIAGLEIPSPLRGTSLMPFISKKSPEVDRKVYAEHVNNTQVMIRTRKYKFITSLADKDYHERFRINAGHRELYDLEKDPGEKTNLAVRFPRQTAELSSEAQAWLADRWPGSAASASAIDEESKEKLRALGYTD